MLNNLEALKIASDMLEEEDFYLFEHKMLFHVMKKFYMQERPVDVHLACEELKRVNRLNEIGGHIFVSSLAAYAGASAHIEEYCDLIKSKSILRKMIEASSIIQRKTIEESDSVNDILDEAQLLFFKIGQTASKSNGSTLKDILTGCDNKENQSYLKSLESRQENYLRNGAGDIVTGLRTHYEKIDGILNGFNNSNLIILAARPAMGKTALAVNIAENICFKNNMPVGIFSLEMSSEQLINRIISSQSHVEGEKILRGSISEGEYQKIKSTVEAIKNEVMIIDDQPGLKISDLKARARRMKEIYGIKFLVIDYLQLLTGSGVIRGSDRQNEISEISRMLKNLARELDIPVLCLSQLSRKVEDRQSKRPVMSDLRESGSIEQDADIVMFLLRREYYDAHDKPGVAELIIAKNRHGATGSVDLLFCKELAKFEDLPLFTRPS